MRTRICIRCGQPTTNASGRCGGCGGGGRKRGASPYATPGYPRLARQAVEQHRRTFGPRCPRCGRLEDRGVRGTWLTYNHPRTLSRGGDVLGQRGEVMCLACNDRQLHVDRPDLSRRRRAR